MPIFTRPLTASRPSCAVAYLPAFHTRRGSCWSTFASRCGTSLSSAAIAVTSRPSGPRDTGLKRRRRRAMTLGTRAWNWSSSILTPCASWSPIPLATCLRHYLTGQARRCCGKHFWLATTTPITWDSWCCCERRWALGRDSLPNAQQRCSNLPSREHVHSPKTCGSRVLVTLGEHQLLCRTPSPLL